MRSDPLPPEALLAHAAWLRRLAEVLTRGDADAEDLVQETWLAALRSPPSRLDACGPALNMVYGNGPPQAAGPLRSWNGQEEV